jgi:hypothetical protein
MATSAAATKSSMPSSTLFAGVFGGFLVICAFAASLPFWLGPLNELLVEWLFKLTFKAGSSMVLASVTSAVCLAAWAHLVQRTVILHEIDFSGGFDKSQDFFGAIAQVIRRWPYVAIFFVAVALLQYSPNLNEIRNFMFVAGGVPDSLIQFSAMVLIALWWLPIVLFSLYLVVWIISCLPDSPIMSDRY